MTQSKNLKVDIIHLKQVLPDAFKDRPPTHSQVWNADLVLRQGKNYVLSADSGRGKSTFIHILYGLRADYSGFVLANNQLELKKLGNNTWAGLRCGAFSIVFQDLRLLQHLTPMQNWVLRADLFGRHTKNLLVQMAERLSVGHLIHTPCGLLSYGERQRVAIIRALIAPFDWLLLDEPFSHLDETNTIAAQNLILQVCANYQAGFVATSLGKDSYEKESTTVFL